MKRYTYGIFLLFLTCLVACTPKQKTSPNIIFIMSDDHASKAISAYDTSLLQTPNIDRLAEGGILFNNCFCTNAICAPSRAVVLTGKYSHLNGILDNSRPFDGSQQTLPKILQKAGYQTAIVGKWHLKSEPTGFDQWLVLPGQGEYYHPDFIGPEGRIAIEGYVTDIITDKGIEFLENMDEDKPFFMMLHHKAPHRNWQPAIRDLTRHEGINFPIPHNLHDDYLGRSIASREQEMSISEHMSMDYDLKMKEGLITGKDTNRELLFNNSWGDPEKRMTADDYKVWEAHYLKRAHEYNELPADPKLIDEWKYKQYLEDYLSCISTLDDNIGRLLNHLESKGLDKNTIIIYTSDQGFFLGEHGWYDKRFMYEEAHRMPLIIHAPEAIAGKDDHLLTNADFAPTILDIAGVDVPDDMQGESFSKVLLGKDMGHWRDAVYYHYFEYPAVHSVKRHYGIRTDRYKLIHFYYDIDAWELYDLKDDPAEMNNLVDLPEYAETLEKLKTELQVLREKYEDTDTEKFLPVRMEEVDHIAKGIDYELEHPPSKRYPGTHLCLTDGFAYPEGEVYAIDLKGWLGLQGEDLVVDIDLGTQKQINQIQMGFLQDQQKWIFLPDTITFYTSEDGDDYMSIQSTKCDSTTFDPRILKQHAEAGYTDLNTRYVRVHVKRKTLPSWHRAAGKPAWLFTDEIIIK